MKVKIDRDICIGCGYCASVCPETFKVGEDEKATVICDVTESNKNAVEDAMAGCPVAAISEDNS